VGHQPDVLGLGGDDALHVNGLPGAVVIAPDVDGKGLHFRSALQQGNVRFGVLVELGGGSPGIHQLGDKEHLPVQGRYLHPHVGVGLHAVLVFRGRRRAGRFFGAAVSKKIHESHGQDLLLWFQSLSSL
jgi:hypothetical protein